MMLAAVASKIRRPSMATRAKSLGWSSRGRRPSRASKWRWVSPRVGDSAGTVGRRTDSAGVAGSGEVLGRAAGGARALAADQVDVAAFADAEADPYVIWEWTAPPPMARV